MTPDELKHTRFRAEALCADAQYHYSRPPERRTRDHVIGRYARARRRTPSRSVSLSDDWLDRYYLRARRGEPLPFPEPE